MVSFNALLQNEFLNNTGQDYAIALGIFIVFFVVFKIIDRYVVVFIKSKAKKTKTRWDDVILDFISAIHWQFYAFVSLYVSLLFLELSDIVNRVMDVLFLIFVAFYVAQGLSRIVDHFTEEQLAKRREEGDNGNNSMIKTFGFMFKGIIYSVAVLMILSNLGIEITPLIASLGIGGVAIAIALQSVLGDLFAAFTIYFDKPFKEGDFIIIGDDMGTIKHIGIKSTRIESLQGQELVVSNSELTSIRINNYKQMQERRIAFNVGVEYGTPLAKLKKINKIVEKVVGSTKHARLDRTHFKEFGDFSLNYEIVYYVESPDYNIYMNVQQEINFKLADAFEKENISFAFPTQIIYLKEGDKQK